MKNGKEWADWLCKTLAGDHMVKSSRDSLHIAIGAVGSLAEREKEILFSPADVAMILEEIARGDRN